MYIPHSLYPFNHEGIVGLLLPLNKLILWYLYAYSIPVSLFLKDDCIHGAVGKRNFWLYFYLFSSARISQGKKGKITVTDGTHSAKPGISYAFTIGKTPLPHGHICAWFKYYTLNWSIQNILYDKHQTQLAHSAKCFK